MSNEFNKDELVPPDWLKEDFFQTVLRSYNKDETVIVKSSIITPGTKPGEHFASIMFKAKVTYDSTKNNLSNEIIQLILKTIPIADGVKMELLKKSSAFPTEMKMYCEIIPEMERLLAKIGDPTVISPR